MTKLRAPISVGHAIDRIAGQLPGGRDQVAAHCERAPRTVLNWSDPDTPESIPLDCAIVLDVAYQRAGGEGAPLFEAYAAQLELACQDAFGDQYELVNRARDVSRETGEAVAAMIEAASPGAGVVERTAALKEGEEALGSMQRAVMTLRRILKMPSSTTQPVAGSEAPP